MQTVAIIPARGGSKGIPRKNLIDFCGKPLLAWSILQSAAAAAVSHVYVSSNDPEILEVAEAYGALPILRPPDLATDRSSSEEALLHALGEIEPAVGPVHLVVFLQATSPVREPEDIDGAVHHLRQSGADSLFSGAVLEDFCLWSRADGVLQGLNFDPANRGVRQDREPLLLENGSIYVFRPEVLRKYGNRLGGRIEIFEMPYWKSFEIDTLPDVEVCRYYFETRLLPRWQPERGHWRLTSRDLDLLVYDFDGVMTDNRVLVLQDGTEGILANRADGLGVERLRRLGIRQMILTTETNPVVRARAAKLGLEIIDSCNDKRGALQNYCTRNGCDLKRVAYVGNDVNDLEAMAVVGFPIAPADAHPEVQKVAWGLTRASGGEGVIKELAERIS
ncbi:MAG: acylneuraminate cytidylyltransferase [Desulfobaccales bacterium]